MMMIAMKAGMGAGMNMAMVERETGAPRMRIGTVEMGIPIVVMETVTAETMKNVMEETVTGMMITEEEVEALTIINMAHREVEVMIERETILWMMMVNTHPGTCLPFRRLPGLF